ncbi:glycosyl hydrolase family 28-related protein [Sphingobacterium deserti]|nr:glycosyl hydrolase family 28-related protein [Sphingobacterium deserti]
MLLLSMLALFASCKSPTHPTAEEKVNGNHVEAALPSKTFINVNDYGILGNGTDVSDKLQKLLDESTGKTIFFPLGNYVISKSIYLVDGIELLGEGDVGSVGGSVIQPVKKSSLQSVFIVRGNTLNDVIFRNIRTLGAKNALMVNIAGGGHVTKVKWYNCVFQEHEIAINVYGGTTSGMYANMFRDCYFKSCNTGIFSEGVYNINIVQGCGFENMRGSFIKIGEKAASALGNSFTENRCESVSNPNHIGLILNKSTYGFYIERNYFENTFKTILQTNGARNVSLNNNVFAANIEGLHAISVNGGNASVRNNTSLVKLILDIDRGGYCSEVVANTLFDFSANVVTKDLGKVNNELNRKFDK